MLRAVDLLVSCLGRSLVGLAASIGLVAPSAGSQDRAKLAESAGRFDAPVEVERRAWRAIEQDGRTAAIELQPELPGVETDAVRIPFAESPRRVRVLSSPRAGCTVVVAGGVHAPLTLLVLRDDGMRSSVVWANARLLAGFERPLLDGTGHALILVYRDGKTIQLRALGLRETQPTILLARRLPRIPELFSASSLLGDPRVRIRLGEIEAFAPGSVEATERAGRAPSFLHPLAALPRCNRVRLEFGEVQTAALVCDNPGRLPVRLRFRARLSDGARLEVRPPSLMLDAGARATFEVTCSLESTTTQASGRLEILGLFDDRDPLAELAIRAERPEPKDSAPPVLDRSKVTSVLLPERRARITGLAGAVVDDSPPCRVLHESGESAVVASDGAFGIEIPLGRDGRLRLQTQDRLGTKSEAYDLGALRDEEAPRVDSTKIRLGLPVRDVVAVRGAPGAISDDTPPLRVRLRVGDPPREILAVVTPDGAFQRAFEARPGDRVRLVAQDGAARFNRSREFEIGRVLPYLESFRGRLRLHGPPHASFEIEVHDASVEGEPPARRRRLLGTFDPSGLVRLEPRMLVGGVALAVQLRLAENGRPMKVRLEIPR